MKRLIVLLKIHNDQDVNTKPPNLVRIFFFFIIPEIIRNIKINVLSVEMRRGWC